MQADRDPPAGKTGRGARRRIRRLAIAALVLLAALLAFGPGALAAWGRRMIVAELERSLYARASLEEMSLSLAGSIGAHRFALLDLEGRPVASLGKLEAEIDVGGALRGSCVVDATIVAPEVHLRQDEEGRWNVVTLIREDEEEEDSDDVGEGKRREGRTLPDVRGEVRLRDGRVIVHGATGRAVLTDLRGSLSLAEGLGRPAPFVLEGTLEGSDGPGGRVKLQGSVTLAPDGRIEVADLRGRVGLDLEEIDLASLEPVLTAALPIGGIRGRLGGRGEVRLERPFAPEVTGAFTLDGVELRGTREGAGPIAIERVRLQADTGDDGAGRLEQRIRLSADDFLAVTYAGTSSDLAAKRTEVAGHAVLEGDLAHLASLARGWLPIREGLAIGGTLGADADLSFARSPGGTGGPGVLTIEGTCGLADFTAVDPERGPVELGDLASASAAVSLSIDLGRGSLELSRFLVQAGPLHARGQVAAEGLGAGSTLRIADSRLDLSADLDALGRTLAGLLEIEEGTIGGELEVQLSAREEDDVAPITCDVEARRLVLGRTEGGEAAGWGDWKAHVEGVFEPGADRLTLSRISIGTDGLDVAGRARLEQVSDPDRITADMECKATSDLAQLVAGLGPVLGVERAVAPELREPEIEIEIDARLESPQRDVELARVKVTSAFLEGSLRGRLRNLAGLARGAARLEGFEGELRYVPDHLAPVLAPWLPGRLSGAEREACTFELDGDLRGPDLFAFLNRSRGQAHVGLGRYETTGLTLTGDVDVELGEGSTSFSGSFDANGGTLSLLADVALTEEGAAEREPSSLHLGAKGVEANSDLGPLLSFVHPAFASLDRLEGTRLGGLIDCDLRLSYDGPLTPELLAGGWEALPKRHVNGEGTFSLNDAVLVGSPLLDDLLAKLDVSATRKLAIRPIRLVVAEGRIAYEHPWTWTLAGAETTFGGSVGLDETLALQWTVPVVDELVERYGFLEMLRGETVRIPIGGTIRHPKIEAKNLLGDLAGTALRRKLQESLGLGAGGGREDPGQLLKRADTLWGAGRKLEAAEIYRRLRKEFRMSLPYVLNRDRIKRRARYTE